MRIRARSRTLRHLSEAAQPTRGRPRSERARTAILDATFELLFERGLHAMSIEEVAERAGVGKATIYRWWPSKELLALDVLAGRWETSIPTASFDTGSLREDLRLRGEAWLGLLADRPFGRVIAGLVAQAQADPEFARTFLDRFIRPRREVGRRTLEHAVERGELPDDLDMELALDLLFGPFWFRMLVAHAPLDERFASAMTDAVIAGLAHARR